MRLLLDTHALIWWLRNDVRLGSSARSALDDDTNEVYVSAISVLEVCTKVRLGKLPECDALATTFELALEEEGFQPLPVTIAHGKLAGNLNIVNKDPFDRVLIAQSLLEGLVLVSNERPFDGFGVSRLW